MYICIYIHICIRIYEYIYMSRRDATMEYGGGADDQLQEQVQQGGGTLQQVQQERDAAVARCDSLQQQLQRGGGVLQQMQQERDAAVARVRETEGEVDELEAQVLQCVTVCCSALHCVATWTSWMRGCCSVLQCVAVSCSVLQCFFVCCEVDELQAQAT